ncbi:MAG: bifunctional folylpolyglutamate synthase/dihydrofolate synthase [Planctomycetota bacterium]|jgi:dihydrofolate synthase/folylpolyglutamate synthase
MSSDSQVPVRSRLDALIDWERRDRSAGMRVDTGPMADLMARLGCPERRARVVHVAGSKGKSSVCACLDAGLRAAGLSTARFTSPHVEALEERVVVDGRPVDGALLDVAIERVLGLIEVARDEGTPAQDATWFDALTAAAFVVFSEAGVDLWIVECGLGGRLDSTNVVPPGPCAITSIELEHTAVLGNTRERIAFEKAGILKPSSLGIAGLDGESDPAGRVIVERAAEVGSRLRCLPPVPGESLSDRNRALAGGLWGGIRECWPELELPPTLSADVDGHGGLPGRLESFELPEGIVVLDGAHTAESATRARSELASRHPQAPVVVFALGRDKDADAVLKALAGWADRILCCAVDPDRQASPEALALKAEAVGLSSETAENPLAALDRALTLASGTWVLAIGSLHLAGSLRPECRRRATDGPRC